MNIKFSIIRIHIDTICEFSHFQEDHIVTPSVNLVYYKIVSRGIYCIVVKNEEVILFDCIHRLSLTVDAELKVFLKRSLLTLGIA